MNAVSLAIKGRIGANETCAELQLLIEMSKKTNDSNLISNPTNSIVTFIKSYMAVLNFSLYFYSKTPINFKYHFGNCV